MKIYVAHAGKEKWDFEGGLYAPLLESGLAAHHDFVLPYRHVKAMTHSENIIKGCDLLLAEVTYPSLGCGIEMAWAKQYGVPVLAIHQEGSKASSSVQAITGNVVTYTDSRDLINIIEQALSPFPA